MPDAYLDELDADGRAAYWRGQVLALPPAQRLTMIVDDGVVVNIDPQVWDRGLGRALLRDMTAELAGLASTT